MSFCRSCGAEIKWIKMTSGKNMPVDATKHIIKKDDGGKDVLVTEGGEIVRGTLTDAQHGNCTGYISHFSTCPNASQHRRR